MDKANSTTWSKKPVPNVDSKTNILVDKNHGIDLLKAIDSALKAEQERFQSHIKKQ